MPSPAAFLQGFGLVQGLKGEDWELKAVEAQHVAIKPWSLYRYDLKLTYEEGSNLAQALEALKTLEERILYTPAGRPYLCWFEDPETAEALTGWARHLTKAELS